MNQAQALFDACRNNDIDTLQQLIKIDEADPNTRFDLGATPLMVATQEGHADIVLFLLKNGADPNISAQNVSPLMIAVARGNVEIGKILVENGANTSYNKK